MSRASLILTAEFITRKRAENMNETLATVNTDFSTFVLSCI
jgi:hypothetical protein